MAKRKTKQIVYYCIVGDHIGFGTCKCWELKLKAKADRAHKKR